MHRTGSSHACTVLPKGPLRVEVPAAHRRNQAGRARRVNAQCRGPMYYEQCTVYSANITRRIASFISLLEGIHSLPSSSVCNKLCLPVTASLFGPTLLAVRVVARVAKGGARGVRVGSCCTLSFGPVDDVFYRCSACASCGAAEEQGEAQSSRLARSRTRTGRQRYHHGCGTSTAVEGWGSVDSAAAGASREHRGAVYSPWRPAAATGQPSARRATREHEDNRQRRRRPAGACHGRRQRRRGGRGGGPAQPPNNYRHDYYGGCSSACHAEQKCRRQRQHRHADSWQRGRQAAHATTYGTPHLSHGRGRAGHRAALGDC